MDIKSQVAARRAELERQAREAAEARRATEKAQREEVLDTLAEELSGPDLTVKRQGEELEILEAPPPAINIQGLKESKVRSLINREARKLWTPAENWQVIGPIVAGVFLITFYGLGLALILFGVMRGSLLNTEYRASVRQRYRALSDFSETKS